MKTSRLNCSHKDSNYKDDEVGVGDGYYPGNGSFEGYDELILFTILCKLPVKSLMRFKAVNKSWQSLIEEIPYSSPKLLISPVRPSAESSMEMKMIGKADDRQQHEESSDAAAVVPVMPCHCFDSDISLPHVTRNAEEEIEPTPRYERSGMLEPIHGLICFYSSENYGSVLIYNPCTGGKTPWLKTKTSEILESIFRQQKLRAVLTVCPLYGERMSVLNGNPGDWKTTYKCMFGFGFDSTTNQHKVLCIYQIHTTKYEDRPYQPGYRLSCEVICEVMTVGENSWRKIDNDQVPPYILPGASSLHVNGSICWLCYNDEHPNANGDYEFVVVFDVRSEKFKQIFIPQAILDLDHRLEFDEVRCWVVYRLIEVNGYLTIVDVDGHDLMSLWIYVDDKKISNESEDGSGYWIQEAIRVPWGWSYVDYLALKTIPGTDLIIIKPFVPSDINKPIKLENIYYYDRVNQIYYGTQVDIKSSCSRPDCGYYDIMTYYETLLPVQKLQKNVALPHSAG